MTTFVKTQFFDKFGSIVLLKVVAKLENNTQNRSVRMKIQCSLGSCACKWFTDTVQNPSILKALGTRNLQVGMGILTFLVIAFFFKCYFSQIKWYWVTHQFDVQLNPAYTILAYTIQGVSFIFYFGKRSQNRYFSINFFARTIITFRSKTATRFYK